MWLSSVRMPISGIGMPLSRGFVYGGKVSGDFTCLHRHAYLYRFVYASSHWVHGSVFMRVRGDSCSYLFPSSKLFRLSRK